MQQYNFTDEQLSYLITLTGWAIDHLTFEGRAAYSEGLITEEQIEKATGNLTAHLDKAIDMLGTDEAIEIDSTFVANFVKAFAK